ncbi:hypothetical protein [Streptococcus sp. zg-JUN1979]|uniref:hypothetical protein n=1 Tax=Streptococcus sp. zg-JUN1979 TaxID=3391450 RepID=UPI0039A6D26F
MSKPSPEVFANYFTGSALEVYRHMVRDYQEHYIHYVYETSNPQTQKRRIKYLHKVFNRLLEHPYHHIRPLTKTSKARISPTWYETALRPLDETAFEWLYNGQCLAFYQAQKGDGKLILTLGIKPELADKQLRKTFYQDMEKHLIDKKASHLMAITIHNPTPDLAEPLLAEGYYVDNAASNHFVKLF